MKDIEVKDAEEIDIKEPEQTFNTEEFLQNLNKVAKARKTKKGIEIEIEEPALEKKISRILQKGPSKWRVQFEDGTSGWVPKKEVK